MFDFFSTRLTDTLDESQALIKICVIKKIQALIHTEIKNYIFHLEFL